MNKKNKYDMSFSNLDKILFPQSAITKGELIEYYAHIAPVMVPYVKDYLVVMHRFPNDITEGFYQKEIPEHFPAWIKRSTVLLKNGEKQTLVVIEKKEDLVYLANQAVVTFHVWTSSYKKPNYPNKIVFDFDPEVEDLKTLRFVIKKMKQKLEDLDLVPFIMTTGSRAYHIVVPIKPTHPFDMVHDFAKKIANEMADAYPDLLTTHPVKVKRQGRIFVDYMRNGFGQTSVAPYSVRALEGAPVATPISWAELGTTKPRKYTIKNILRRLARITDPWKDFKKMAKKLKL